MIRNRILLKSFAAFFIIEMVVNTMAPTISWALTSGPTAPEATSFEPVDTTDMVNTITGDFVYNMPILEVPGPAGGYPLSLSYHAGAQPNMDASWVGLGFTLNPGSISRLSNGLPDDYNGSKSTNRVLWEGGSETVKTYGLSYGIGNIATVSAGLSFGQDTYRGRGIGGYGGLGLQIPDSRVGVNLTVGSNPWGQSYSSIGVGISGQVAKGLAGSLSVGIDSQGGLGASAGVGVAASGNRYYQATGISISSGGGQTKVSTSAGGFSSGVNNSQAGKISTSTDGFNFDIPVYYGINIHLGRTYTRYWMDQKETYSNYGSLYFPTGDVDGRDKKIFDTYHLMSTASLSSGQNPEKYIEGSLADYDMYSVNAQGLGGNIRPYHYNLNLASQDLVQGSLGGLWNYYIPQQDNGVQYRFVNDFSNKLVSTTASIQVHEKIDAFNPARSQTTPAEFDSWLTKVKSKFTASENIPLLFPYCDYVTGAGEPDINLSRVPGSKNIEYFTNEDIINDPATARSKGFIDCHAAGFVRSATDGKIGGFSITNASGVVYNFTLPAYSYAESVYSQNKDDKGKTSFNNTQQNGKYAYTWYLSSIVGVDYVDRGPDGAPDGKLNDFDWGYWVDFQYGKWTDNYNWRNPSEGFNDDFDNNFQTFSKGKKEIYYLNAIKTKTHTALFVKEMRADGKSTTSLHESSVLVKDKTVTWVDEGGFDILQGKTGYYDEDNIFVNKKYYEIPTAVLSLKSVLLFENKDIPNELSSYNSLSNDYVDSFSWTDPDLNVMVSRNLHFGQNVLDVHDILSAEFPGSKALRKIDFDYDYSLSPGTSNSFDEAGLLYACESPCLNSTPNSLLTKTKLGKLTLNAVTFKGKGGSEALPATKFRYDYTSPVIVSGTVTSVNVATQSIQVNVSQQSTQFVKGDIVIFHQRANDFYGFVTDISTNLNVKIITSALPAVGIFYNLRKTKNPPYNKDLFDFWGLYKVDYINLHEEGNIDRKPSAISAFNSDAWCLREIQTSVGAKIKVEFEPDTYGKSVYSNNNIAPLTFSSNTQELLTVDYPGHAKIFLESNLTNDSQVEFDKLYKKGDDIFVVASITGCSAATAPDNCIFGANIISSRVEEVSSKSIRIQVFINYEHFKQFNDGIIQLKVSSRTLGGGTRVKSIGVYDNFQNQARLTGYTYEFSGTSSGVTSYEPVNVGKYYAPFGMTEGEFVAYPGLANQYINILSLARELPAPGVYYGKVRIDDWIINRNGELVKVPNHIDYEFETFSEGLLQKKNIATSYYSEPNTTPTGDWLPPNELGKFKNLPYYFISARSVALRDYTQHLGNLKSVTTYDDNDVPLNKMTSNYLYDEQTSETSYSDLIKSRYNSQGVIQETFQHARLTRVSSPLGEMQGVVTRREVYPSIQTGQTSINYKTGITTTTKNLAFDFYSGQVIKTISTDGYGNTYLSESIPAYQKYNAMGLAINGGKNMLTQESASYTYKIDPTKYKIDPTNSNAKTGLVSASVQTWSDQIPSIMPSQLSSGIISQDGIWRKHASYSFIGDNTESLSGDGFYSLTSKPIPYFTAWDGKTEAGALWQKNGEITLYDVNSHALEATDINQNYAATKMTFDQTRILVTGANCEYQELAYSGAEEKPTGGRYGLPAFGGGVHCNGTWTNEQSHTGMYSVKAAPGSTAFSYDLKPKESPYIVSFWSSQPLATVKYQQGLSTAVTATVKNVGRAGNWYLLEATIPSLTGTGQLEIWNEALTSLTYFDDFRVHPFDAAITSYVYNEWGELSHILDNNNLYTEYRYDGMGRLKETYKETFNYGVVNTGTIRYHYQSGN